MHVLITIIDPVICSSPHAPLHCLPFCKVKWYYFEGMWKILRASFWKCDKLSNSRLSLNWSRTDEVQSAIQQLTFLAHSVHAF